MTVGRKAFGAIRAKARCESVIYRSIRRNNARCRALGARMRVHLSMRAGTTARHHALAEPHRARLVELLKASVDAVPVEKLAAEVDLHPNTVRAHLDVLVRAGLVSAETEQSGRPGRPRRLFRALTSDEGEHELLAAALTGSLARAVDGARLAEAAGYDWGRYLVERLPPDRDPSAAVCAERLTRLLAERGFQPHAEEDRILMRRCPFRQLAERYPAVVCSLHRGLLNGALEELGAPVAVESLVPFVETDLCEARLSAVSAEARGHRRRPRPRSSPA